MENAQPSFLLTVDLEDWFQVENFKTAISFSTWDSREQRVERNTHRLLDLFDSLATGSAHPKCTFFILGWTAQKYPRLVREIYSRGHEVASHGFHHHLCTQQSPKDLRQDLTDSKACLEGILGAPVFGYRAPSFSINTDVLNIIKECGYRYDSSYNSFGLHERYGKIDLAGFPKSGIAYRLAQGFFELPISNLTIFKKILPWGGGGYFRLFPFSVFSRGINTTTRRESAFLFYMHPWEIDPAQPKVDDIPKSFKFRHYINLDKTYSRLSCMIEKFQRCRFISLQEYLRQVAA